MNTLKATPSFLIELMNASRGLNDKQAELLVNKLNLENASVLTYENVRRAQNDTEEVVSPFSETRMKRDTKVEPPTAEEPATIVEPDTIVDPDTFDTKLEPNTVADPSQDEDQTGVVSVEPIPVSNENESVFTPMPGEPEFKGLNENEIPHYLQQFLLSDSSISIWAKEVIPIMNIMINEVRSGKEVLPSDIRNILQYYSKGNEPEGASEEWKRRIDSGEIINIEKERAAPINVKPSTTSEESVFGKTPGERAEEATSETELNERLKEFEDVPAQSMAPTRNLKAKSNLSNYMSLKTMMF